MILAALILAWGGIEELLQILGGGKPIMIYDQVPLAYLFQTGDLALIAVFLFFAVRDVVRILNDDE